MLRITIINKGVNKDVNIPEPRELLFRISTIKIKVTALLLSCEMRTGRIIVIRVTKIIRVL